MAIGAYKKANTQSVAQGGGIVQPVGAQLGCIVQVQSDMEATAATATELLAPFGFAGSGAQWIIRGPGIARAYFYARMLVGGTVVTDPIIRIYGAFPLNDSSVRPEANNSAVPNDGTWRAARLDNADWNAAGLTLDLVTSGATLNQDATYAYSDETDVIDLQDCYAFIALCETAANVTSSTVELYARCIA